MKKTWEDRVMRRLRRAGGPGFYALLGISVAVACAGCGGSSGGPPLVEVSGTVTHQGQPLEALMVHFQPETGRPSYGVTDDQGNYSLEYSPQQQGAVKGQHRVFVSFVPPTPEVEMAIFEGRHKHSPEIAFVLNKYGDPQTTPLDVEVTESRVVNLELD